MSVSVTTSDIDIVAVNVRPKSAKSNEYVGDFVQRSGSSRSTVAFSFSSTTVSGNYSAFGKSFSYYVHGAKEDWEQRRASNNKVVISKKKNSKVKKNGKTGFKKRYFLYTLLLLFIYIFRDAIYENEDILIGSLIELFSIILEVIKILIISFFKFAASLFGP